MAPLATGGSATGISRSGIAQNQDGQRHIPSSVRADGSVRKEIRVRDGYRPPEDVDVYKSKTAETWKNRGKGGVPGAEAVSNDLLPTSAAANKNAKRREARKKAAATAGTSEDVQGGDTGGKELNNSGAASQEASIADPEAEKAKEARKLSKKLRQARDLKDKKDQGDALIPEQLEKVIKIKELIRQLDKLGFNAEGEKKDEKI